MIEQRIRTGTQWGTLRVSTPERILGLRHAELRPGRPRREAELQGDMDPAARHYAAFEEGGAGEPIGCVSCMPSEWEGERAYQLRGMAVRSDRTGRGIGGALLRFVERDMAATGVRLLWCNARLHAVGFYEKHGWEAVSEVFEIPGVGPHRRLLRRLDG
jgi:GNAT superfamily N-acetyltransferase